MIIGGDTISWPSVSLVILNWNGRFLLEQYLPSFLALEYPNYQIVLVDNGSTDDSVAYVAKHFPQIKLIAHKENLGFASGLNLAITKIDSDIVVLLNNDVEVRPDWLRALISPLKADNSIGIAGCKLLYPDGKTIQHAGASLTYPLALSHHYYYQEIDTGQADERRDVEYVTGAAMAITRPVIDAIGLLDEAFSPYYYEEVDYCYRARKAGFRIIYEPEAVAVHHESLMMKQVGVQKLFALEKNRYRFVLRHYSSVQFFDEFMPAELERVQNPLSANVLYQLRRAIIATRLQLAGILSESSDKYDKLIQYEAAFDMLRGTVLLQRPRVFNEVPQGIIETTLSEKERLAEPSFSSDLPIVGAFVWRFREAFNNVSTKWYVRALIQQQMEFNQLVRRLMGEQDQQAEAMAQEIDLLTEQLVMIQQRVVELEALLPTNADGQKEEI